MACIKSDGTLTETAKSIMKLLQNPLSIDELSSQMNKPIFLMRSFMRELADAGFVKEVEGKYSVTANGKEKTSGK